MKGFVRGGLLAVLTGMVVLVLLGPAPAQPPGWNERRSPFGPAGFRGGPTTSTTSAKTWHCPRCNRELARGDSPPSMVHCCGLMYQNGQTPFRTGPFADSLVASTPVVAATPAAGAAGATAAAASGIPTAAAAGVPSVFRVLLWASAGFFSLLLAGGVAVLVVQNRRQAAASSD